MLELVPCPPGAEPLLGFHGVALDGRRCAAVTAAGHRCPKDSAVAWLFDGWRPIHACGGHADVHRRGRRPMLMVSEP